MDSLTRLLTAARDGDKQAIGHLFEQLYPQLRRIAHARLVFRDDRLLLDTCALIHESYLKLLDGPQVRADDRDRFLAYAASVMRSVVVDTVRERQAARRGGGPKGFVTLNTVALNAAATPEAGEQEILAVHGALSELERVDERLARVVEMRYFVGLSNDEIARAMGVTVRTVIRDWDKARMFLFRAINPS